MLEFFGKLFTPGIVVYAADDIGAQITDGIWQVFDIAKSIANPLLVIGIAICAIYLMVLGGDRDTIKKVKTMLICMIVGAILLNIAKPLATWILSIGAA